MTGIWCYRKKDVYFCIETEVLQKINSNCNSQVKALRFYFCLHVYF